MCPFFLRHELNTARRLATESLENIAVLGRIIKDNLNPVTLTDALLYFFSVVKQSFMNFWRLKTTIQKVLIRGNNIRIFSRLLDWKIITVS